LGNKVFALISMMTGVLLMAAPAQMVLNYIAEFKLMEKHSATFRINAIKLKFMT